MNLQPTQKLYNVIIDGAPVLVTIEELKVRTIELYAAMRRNQETSDRAFVLWGDLLRQLKPQVGHGHWEMFLQACDVHMRTAQRAVKMAKACIINGRFDVSMAHSVMEADRQGTLAKKLQRQSEDSNAQEMSHLDDRDTPGHPASNAQEMSHLRSPGHTAKTVEIGMGFEDEDDILIDESDIAQAPEAERDRLRAVNAEIAARRTSEPPRAEGKVQVQVRAPETRDPKPETRPAGGQMDMGVLYEAAEKFRAQAARVFERMKSGLMTIDEVQRITSVLERV